MSTRASKDGSTTLLHHLIEYIMNESEQGHCANFYEDFGDLSGVANIQDLTTECLAWKKNLQSYKAELDIILESEATKKIVRKTVTRAVNN